MIHNLYNNYDLWDTWKGKALENIFNNRPGLGAENISEDDICEEINYIDEDNWYYAKECIEKVLNNHNHIIVVGSYGLWYTKQNIRKIFNNFDELISFFNKDWAFVNIYDEDGRLFMEGRDHEGIDEFEIKILNDKGFQIYQKWFFYDDKRSEEEIYDMLFKSNLYTSLPRIYKKTRKEG